jgi:hypothetical protein
MVFLGAELTGDSLTDDTQALRSVNMYNYAFIISPFKPVLMFRMLELGVVRVVCQ